MKALSCRVGERIEIQGKRRRRTRRRRRKQAISWIYWKSDILDGELHSVQTFLLHICSTCLGQYIFLHVRIPEACQVCGSCRGKSTASCLRNTSDSRKQNVLLKSSVPFWSNSFLYTHRLSLSASIQRANQYIQKQLRIFKSCCHLSEPHVSPLRIFKFFNWFL